MFKVCQAIVFSKVDTISVFDFDLKKAEARILKLNPKAAFFPLSAKTGEGVEALAAYLVKQIIAYQSSK
jgi:hydrogenase nickel incorporation protein HypB